jgi:hypothetical protein
MKRIHYALLTGEALSYALVIVFIFADAKFDLTGVLRSDRAVLSPQLAYVASCLVGIVGCINVWLTWYYIHKANTLRDWLVICAWTHRVKRHGRWLTLEEFLTEHLGYRVSHGLSDPSLVDLKDEVDSQWRRFPTPTPPPDGDSPPAGATEPAPPSPG